MVGDLQRDLYTCQAQAQAQASALDAFSALAETMASRMVSLAVQAAERDKLVLVLTDKLNKTIAEMADLVGGWGPGRGTWEGDLQGAAMGAGGGLATDGFRRGQVAGLVGAGSRCGDCWVHDCMCGGCLLCCRRAALLLC